MKQPWGKETQVCTNKVPGVINSPARRRPSFVYIHKANSLENLLLLNHWPEWFLNWHVGFLGQGNLRLFKSQGDKWPAPRKGPKKGIFVLKSSDEPVDQMQNYLAKIIPMTCRYKSLQLLSLGSHMTPP